MAQFWSEEYAQGMAEYGLILALIALAVLFSFDQMVQAIPSGLQPVTEKLSK